MHSQAIPPYLPAMLPNLPAMLQWYMCVQHPTKNENASTDTILPSALLLRVTKALHLLFPCTAIPWNYKFVPIFLHPGQSYVRPPTGTNPLPAIMMHYCAAPCTVSLLAHMLIKGTDQTPPPVPEQRYQSVSQCTARAISLTIHTPPPVSLPP